MRAAAKALNVDTVLNSSAVSRRERADGGGLRSEGKEEHVRAASQQGLNWSVLSSHWCIDFMSSPQPQPDVARS